VGASVRASDVHIPEPCHEDWDRMLPEARGRFCAACKKTVHDLSSMTEADARALLARSAADDICVSYVAGDEDRIRFRPAPVVPIGRLRKRPAVAAGLAAGLGLALAACAPHGEPDALRIQVEDAPIAAQPVVVPGGAQARPVEPPADLEVARPEPPAEPAAAEDEPCDPPAVQQTEERVKGRRVMPPRERRTGGKPVLRRDSPLP
jgi:hypothetical protein